MAETKGTASAETWATIPEYPAYQVSDCGRVRRATRASGTTVGQVLVQDLSNGYHRVHLTSYGRYVFTHRLVLSGFVGPCPPGCETRHLNGIRNDNRLANLAWGTKTENGEDRKVHGTSPRGPRNHAAKLTAEKVAEIRRRYANGTLQRVLAAEYGVNQPHVSRIVRGANWAQDQASNE
jgi:hypothetical protein